MNLGYLVGTAIAAIFLAAVVAQVKAKGFHPFCTGRHHRHNHGRHDAGRFCGSIAGIGYAGGSSLLLALLLGSLLSGIAPSAPCR
jgi:hypothetical protein